MRSCKTKDFENWQWSDEEEQRRSQPCSAQPAGPMSAGASRHELAELLIPLTQKHPWVPQGDSHVVWSEGQKSPQTPSAWKHYCQTFVSIGYWSIFWKYGNDGLVWWQPHHLRLMLVSSRCDFQEGHYQRQFIETDYKWQRVQAHVDQDKQTIADITENFSPNYFIIAGREQDTKWITEQLCFEVSKARTLPC